jgi:hypothetical protein
MLAGERAAATAAWLASDALRHRDGAVRRGAAVALGRAARRGGPGAAEAAVGVAERLRKEDDPAVLAALADAHAHLGDGAPDGALLDALEHREGAVARAAVDALVEAGRAAAVPAEAAALLLAHRHPWARAAGVVLAEARGGLAPEGLARVRRDPEEVPRAALAEALGRDLRGRGDAPDALDALDLLLADPSWRVRATAIDAATRRRGGAAIPLLVERIPAEDGRLRLDLADALARLTGKDLGLDVEQWRAWWSVKGAGFDPASVDPTRGPADLATRTAAFFRLPVLSTRVAFLVDCSGSMREDAVGEAAAGLTKYEVARRELVRTLGTLDERTSFDVFLYRYPSGYPPRPAMTRAFRRLEPATPARALAAGAWMADQEPKGWGAFYDALRLLLDEDVDTIYFLTDGRPSRGLYDRDERLVEELARDNRFRRVAVSTVLVGTKGADRDFLVRLAAATGGRFTDAAKEALRGE